MSIAWYGAGMMIFAKAPLQLFVLNGGMADTLKPFATDDWTFSDTIGNSSDLSEYDMIALDWHAHNDKDTLKKLANVSLHGKPLIHASAVYEQYSGRTPIEYILEEGLFQFFSGEIYEYGKRLTDLFMAVFLGVLTSPIMLITAVIIKAESHGPVLFSQERIGQDNESFILYKFRSMSVNSEKEGAQFAQKDDARITRFGNLIRKFRIDELPQFWNVLKGDMSLIGPRPERPIFVDLFKEEIPFYAYRHKVRPGITGWAQIKDGYADGVESTKRKLEYDFYYIKNLSFSLDLLIIYATIKTILTGFGSR